MTIREDALTIIKDSITAVLPEEAVRKALDGKKFHGDVYLVAIGKAAWTMASATEKALGSRLKRGVVVTKYEHSEGEIESCEIIEAGHPIPDKNSVLGASKALELVSGLSKEDQLIFLISGGGSALFEKPLEGLTLSDIQNITDQLLKCGADIVEINTVRKHLSAVKGGRFAEQCGADILAIVLSDVIGDHLDAIASGPAYPDQSTSQDAFNVIHKYQLEVNDAVLKALEKETPKTISNCETLITGNVQALCDAAAKTAKQLGYEPRILSTTVETEAKEYGAFLASEGIKIKNGSSEIDIKPPCALIAGGETVVYVKGKGKGGRNQELALSAALEIEGAENLVLFSVGSDGTDGPTDAAGGIVDGKTIDMMLAKSVLPQNYLDDNNAYYALEASGDLIMTGPTGTNVNDLMVVLCK